MLSCSTWVGSPLVSRVSNICTKLVCSACDVHFVSPKSKRISLPIRSSHGGHALVAVASFDAMIHKQKRSSHANSSSEELRHTRLISFGRMRDTSAEVCVFHNSMLSAHVLRFQSVVWIEQLRKPGGRYRIGVRVGRRCTSCEDEKWMLF